MNKLQARPLPDPKKTDLIPPDMGYLYFNDGDSPGPDPGNREYSESNAWWFAECAFLAYTHPGFARMAYRLAGYEGYRFFGGKGTECMVAWNEDLSIVSFRGTELKSLSALHEIRTDLNAVPVSFEPGGMVHRGFLLGLQEVWDGDDGLKIFLEELRDSAPDRPLWVCGHSLGGALASLCFASISFATGLYVYGAPRVGDGDFTRLFEGRPAWRIENSRDPVPMVPPDLPKIKFNFKDIGSLRYLNWDGRVLDQRPEFVLEEQKTRYREVKQGIDVRLRGITNAIRHSARSSKDNARIRHMITDHLDLSKKEWNDQLGSLFRDYGLKVDEHQPIYYATKLWNRLVELQNRAQ